MTTTTATTAAQAATPAAPARPTKTIRQPKPLPAPNSDFYEIQHPATAKTQRSLSPI